MPLSCGRRWVTWPSVQCTTCRAKMLPRGVVIRYGWLPPLSLEIAKAGVNVSTAKRERCCSRRDRKMAVTMRYGHAAPAGPTTAPKAFPILNSWSDMMLISRARIFPRYQSFSSPVLPFSPLRRHKICTFLSDLGVLSQTLHAFP
jgi:hypothetical protein